MIVFTGLSGSGKSQPGLRHDLRRGPAPLRRVAVGLRPAVPGPDGQARRRLHRGPVAGGLDRPEVDLAATRARPSARSPRSTTTCACSTPASASRTARSAASRSPSRPRSRSSTASSRCPRAPGSRCSRRSSASARASTSTCSPTCRPRAYARVRVDGVVHPLTEPPKLKKQEKHTIEVVVDRLVGAGRRASSASPTRSRPRSAWPAAWSSSTSSTCPRTTRTASGASPSGWPARTTTRWPSTSSSRGRSRSTRRSAPARSAPASAPARRSTPSWSSPTPSVSWPTGAIAPWAGRPDQRVLPAAAAGRRRRDRLRPRHPVGAAAGPRRRRRSCTAPADQVHVSYRNRYGRDRSYYAAYEGVVAVDRAAPRRDRQRLLAREVRGLHARGARARRARAPGSSRRSSPSPSTGRSIAELSRAVDRRRAPTGCARSTSTTATR